jgi:hypothetical protein
MMSFNINKNVNKLILPKGIYNYFLQRKFSIEKLNGKKKKKLQ